MEIKDYLKRIGFTGELKLDYATLTELQYRHLLSVPYENLDIVRKTPLSLEIKDLYDKIIIRGRGGYCFELNALFNWLLCELGFKTVNYFARFLLDEKTTPMRRHRVMRVEIDGAYYLADVGVGTITPEKSLKLIENEETEVRGLIYKFAKEKFLGWVLYFKKNGGEFIKLYSFTEEQQLELDYIQPSFYCEKHPESIFNKKNIVAIRTDTGKYTLDGNVFNIIDFKTGTSVSKKEYNGDEIPGVLKKYFGIEL